MKKMRKMFLVMGLAVILTACGEKAEEKNETQNITVTTQPTVSPTPMATSTLASIFTPIPEPTTTPEATVTPTLEPTTTPEATVTPTSDPTATPVATLTPIPEPTVTSTLVPAGENSCEQIEVHIGNEVENTVAVLTSELEKLAAELDSYEKYKDNVDKVEAYYEKIYSDTEVLYVKLYGYCAEYAELILAADTSCSEKYDEIDEIYDVIYEAAADKIYDEIYDELFDVMYDTFYDGVLEEAQEQVPYSEWLDVHSEEYSMWLDTHSEVYEEWLDFRSTLYDFWLDIRSDLFSKELEKAGETLQDFKEDYEKKAGKYDNEKIQGEQAAVLEKTQIPLNEGAVVLSYASIEELETVIEGDVEATIAGLASELENLAAQTASYEAYADNIDAIKDFYTTIHEETRNLALRMYGYSLNYAELVLETEESFHEKYEDMEDIYDLIYEDVGDEIYDGIYDGILNEMYDVFYDGILDEAYDDVAYPEWSTARSDEYDRWSDTRSDVYDEWKNCRSDVYEFCSDLRRELWDKDKERVDKIMADFKADYEELAVIQ